MVKGINMAITDKKICIYDPPHAGQVLTFFPYIIHYIFRGRQTSS
ncbi:MAG: hypothetical protein BWY72_01815 [Bacteroidetes bacterium ADurb.Bin416]|nr:MAG: hypothetical protein BWY72_01815 [Bacteroidetes bacterium ADurb.Bin416]